MKFRGVTITFVPAQHFSGRGLGQPRPHALGRVGDPGVLGDALPLRRHAYFSGFKEIGRRFPGIDVAMLPIGAYDPRWFMQPVHVDPEEALQAFEDLGARTFVAMHWGTFKQADEPLDEPPVRLEAERVRRAIAPERVRVLAIGETLDVGADAADRAPNGPDAVPPSPPPNVRPGWCVAAGSVRRATIDADDLPASVGRGRRGPTVPDG